MRTKTKGGDQICYQNRQKNKQEDSTGDWRILKDEIINCEAEMSELKYKRDVMSGLTRSKSPHFLSAAEAALKTRTTRNLQIFPQIYFLFVEA